MNILSTEYLTTLAMLHAQGLRPSLVAPTIGGYDVELVSVEACYPNTITPQLNKPNANPPN